MIGVATKSMVLDSERSWFPGHRTAPLSRGLHSVRLGGGGEVEAGIVVDHAADGSVSINRTWRGVLSWTSVTLWDIFPLDLSVKRLPRSSSWTENEARERYLGRSERWVLVLNT